MAEYNENIVNENDISWLRNDKEATVTFCSGNRFKNRVLKLAKDYPEEVRIVAENEDGSICAKLPISYIRISRPVRRELTEEQREVAVKRLQELREKKEKEKENENK